LKRGPHDDDRIVLTLEQRQLFFVFIGTLVLASGILVLGYVLGRRYAGGDHETPGETLVAAEASAERDVDLTFQQALVEPTEQLARPPAPPPEPPPAVRPGADETIPEPVAEPEARPGPKRAAEPPAAKPAPPAEKPARKAAPPTPQRPKKSDSPSEPTAAAVSAKVDALSAQAMEALERLRGGNAKAEAPLARYTLQVSAFQDRSEAQALVDSLRKKGHNPYLTSSVVPGRGRWHRVRIGRFDARGAAEAFRHKFEASAGLTTFVTRL